MSRSVCRCPSAPAGVPAIDAICCCRQGQAVAKWCGNRGNATMPQCHNATMPQCHNATMPQCDNATMRQCDNALLRRGETPAKRCSLLAAHASCTWISDVPCSLFCGSDDLRRWVSSFFQSVCFQPNSALVVRWHCRVPWYSRSTSHRPGMSWRLTRPDRAAIGVHAATERRLPPGGRGQVVPQRELQA